VIIDGRQSTAIDRWTARSLENCRKAIDHRRTAIYCSTAIDRWEDGNLLFDGDRLTIVGRRRLLIVGRRQTMAMIVGRRRRIKNLIVRQRRIMAMIMLDGGGELRI
jgi:hypothetical protein